LIINWLQSVGAVTAPLFDSDGLEPRVFLRGGMRKLKRHPDFDDALIKVVEDGLEQESWQGFIYVMHFGQLPDIAPLYIGKTERKGTTQELSFNIKNVRSNQHAFGRWGYGLAYHIGDLSHAIFQEGSSYKPPARKYKRWADHLFESIDPLRLKRIVNVSLISWHAGSRGPSGLQGSVPAVEKELIALCGAWDKSSLLNVDGR
jgi:hypothetical protein